jgi:hypothetical protein
LQHELPSRLCSYSCTLSDRCLLLHYVAATRQITTGANVRQITDSRLEGPAASRQSSWSLVHTLMHDLHQSAVSNQRSVSSDLTSEGAGRWIVLVWVNVSFGEASSERSGQQTEWTEAPAGYFLQASARSSGSKISGKLFPLPDRSKCPPHHSQPAEYSGGSRSSSLLRRRLWCRTVGIL